MRKQAGERSGETGTTIIEFVLVTTLVLTPLLLGTMVVGFNLIRDIQTHQIAQDAGHMFARGVDFSTSTTGTGNRAVLTYMTPRLAISTSRGTGVLILSSIEYIGTTTCASCANRGHAVFTRQITIGNASLFGSKFGTVPASSMATDGSGTVTNPLTDPAVIADGILAVLDGTSFTGTNYTMNDSQIAYVSEAYYTSADFNITGFLSPGAVYARAIF